MIGNEEGHSELFGLLSENTRTDIDLVSKLFVKNIFNSIKNWFLELMKQYLMIELKFGLPAAPDKKSDNEKWDQK